MRAKDQVDHGDGQVDMFLNILSSPKTYHAFKMVVNLRFLTYVCQTIDIRSLERLNMQWNKVSIDAKFVNSC